MLEVIAVIRNVMSSCTNDLFQHALVKSLQRLDKAGLEIKEKQYEALSSVVRKKNDTSIGGVCVSTEFNTTTPANKNESPNISRKYKLKIDAMHVSTSFGFELLDLNRYYVYKI